MCPNFSEGKDQSIIDKIVQPIIDNDSVALLDIDMGSDFHRTVVTMVGERIGLADGSGMYCYSPRFNRYAAAFENI